LFHVLEHVPHPLEFIRYYVDFFKEFGTISEIKFIIECPVIELETNFLADPTPFWAPFHTVHFSFKTFEAMLIKAGLKITQFHAFPDYNGLMMICEVDSNVSEILIDVQAERAKILNYKKNYSLGMENIRIEMEYRLSKFRNLVLFGAGMGLEYFLSSFPELIDNKNVIILDSDSNKHSEYVFDPKVFFKSLSDTNDVYFLIPTSYSKSREINKYCLNLLRENLIDPHRIDFYYYPLVRSY
jgi:hypothetical protein